MQRQTVINKMREMVQDFREQLAKGDVSSIPALTRNSGTFFRELTAELPESWNMDEDVQIFAGCVERFGVSCGNSDRQAAAETLLQMEDVLARSEAGRVCP